MSSINSLKYGSSVNDREQEQTGNIMGFAKSIADLVGRKKIATEGNEAALKQLLLGKQEEANLRRPHEQSMEQIAQQNADTNERYRLDQATKMQEDARKAKLGLLFGSGGAGGATGAPTMGAEAAKTSGLIDAARQSLNSTADLTAANKGAAIAERLTPNFAVDMIGGKMKDIRDSRSVSKEAMQNVYTGAAASGQQEPSFQAWSGPGVMDIIRGNTSGGAGVRDALNTVQQNIVRQAPTPNPDILKEAGMQDDPLAQSLLKKQMDSAKVRDDQKLRNVPPAERALIDEIKANPSHPNAEKAKQDLMRKYGNIF